MEEITPVEQELEVAETKNTVSSGTTRKNKRKKALGRPHEDHYQGINFSSLESSKGRPQPGHPLRFFSSSYNVEFCNDHQSNINTKSETGSSDDNNNDKETKYSSLKQIVHRHANGLVIVTAGSTFQNFPKKSNNDAISTTVGEVNISSFKFTLEVSKSQSVGGKRKRARKMKKGSGNVKLPDTVEPNDTLAIATLSNGKVIEIKCCVAGTLLEINDRLSSDLSLLTKDPLLDGYLAVIMPSTFPSVVK